MATSPRLGLHEAAVYIPAQVHHAAISHDYDLIAKLLENETIEHLFTIYVRLKYLNLDLYLDYIVRLAREKRRRYISQRVLEQALPLDVARYIIKYV